MGIVLDVVLAIALAIHVGLAAVCISRVWRGENVIDRLLSADVIGTIALGVLVIVAMFARNLIFLDAALGLAALATVGTIALSRLIANRRVL
jgi:multisubunit Na+/H+ antiporter MnhF subunit